MSQSKVGDHLDALLRGCEDIVIGASSLDKADVASNEVDATSAFIAMRLAQRRSAASTTKGRQTTRKVAIRRAVPRDPAGRRRLLGRLIASRPELPARISMAFKSREPEDAEIAEMLDELLRSEDGPVG